MSEKEIGKALLRGEDPIDLAEITDRVIRRDRRRVWVLGVVCVIAWMVVVMLPWATILPMLAKLIEQQAAGNGSATTRADEQSQSILLAEILKEGVMATFFGSIASMFAAAICTVWLILVSRRATLRQVNARLAEISAQLKAMAGGVK